MHTNTSRVAYEDSYSSTVEESKGSLFIGIMAPLDAGKDLNNISMLIKEHFCRGFDTLEIEITPKLFEQTREQLELLQRYCPFLVEMNEMEQEGKVLLTCNYKEAKPFISPLKWNVSYLSPTSSEEPDESDSTELEEIISPILKGIDTVFGLFEKPKKMSKKTIRAILDKGHEAGLQTMEVEISNESYLLTRTYLEVMVSQTPFLEKLNASEQDETTLLSFTFAAPKDRFTEDDIPEYVLWFSSPETCEDSDLSNVNDMIDIAHENDVSEITIEMDTYRYERIKRKLEKSKREREFKTYISVSEQNEKTTILKVCLINRE